MIRIVESDVDVRMSEEVKPRKGFSVGFSISIDELMPKSGFSAVSPAAKPKPPGEGWAICSTCKGAG